MFEGHPQSKRRKGEARLGGEYICGYRELPEQEGHLPRDGSCRRRPPDGGAGRLRQCGCRTSGLPCKCATATFSTFFADTTAGAVERPCVPDVLGTRPPDRAGSPTRSVNYCYDVQEKAHGQDEMLRSRFKRNHGRPLAPYIPRGSSSLPTMKASQMSGSSKEG